MCRLRRLAYVGQEHVVMRHEEELEAGVWLIASSSPKKVNEFSNRSHLNAPTPVATTERHFSVMSPELGWNTNQVYRRLRRRLIASGVIVASGVDVLRLVLLAPHAPRGADFWQTLE